MVKTIKLRKKINNVLTFCLIAVLPQIFNPILARDYKVKTVVLDAGHGGDDSGARGAAGSYEKFVTLQVVLLLGKKIETAFPDVKVIYTRKTDVFIPLFERAGIANRNKADLFISVHCNSSTSRTPYGTETFVLGQHKTDDQFDVARRENSVIALEKDADENYDGFDPNAPESSILWSLNLNAYLEQSMLLADKVQNQYTNKLERTNRGVKQAGFVVLYRTTMPSILTEIGFLSNTTEERYLVSPKGQDEIADALLQAFKAYKSTMENTSGSVLNTVTTIPETPQKNTPTENTPIKSTPSNPPLEVKAEVNNSATVSSTGVNFKIQIAVTSQMVNIRQAPYNNIKLITFEKVNNMYKYLAGNYSNYDEVKSELDKIKSHGFKDAFIVVYKQGVRLNANDAKIYLQ